jgi:hypothetical protein
LQNRPEIHMLNQKSHHLPRHLSADKALLSTAMAFAQEVAAKFQNGVDPESETRIKG